jgi:HK97 family phage major capsid protein
LTLQADLIAANDKIAAKQAAMSALFEGLDDLSGTKASERAASIKAANDELSDLGEERDKLQDQVDEIEKGRANLKAASRRSNRMVEPTIDKDENEDEPVETGYKSVGAMLSGLINEHSGLKASGEGLRGFRGKIGELNGLKTLISSASLAPLPDRQPIVPSALETATTADLMLQGTTGAQVIDYYEETTYTNAAREVAEGVAKAEGALDFTLRQDPVRKIATWIPVTDEMLADVPAFESYLRERLGFMVKRREEHQLLTGDASTPNIDGLLHRSGVQTVTGLGMSTIDSIYKAITQVRAIAFSEPTAMVVHPNDWFDIRTSKDGFGNYLLGPANTEGDLRIWSLQVRVTTEEPENTALVGAFRPHAQIFRRSAIEVAISTENEDYFIKNKVAVRAEERLALAVYRPAAFCKVEGLVQGS